VSELIVDKGEISEGNTTERSMRPIFYYFGRGRIMTKIRHPFHLVKIITNDGKFGGTNLIMTEGKIDPEVKILIKKGLIEKGLRKKVTARFYRYIEEDKIEHKDPPLTWCLTIGPGFTIDYSRRTIVIREDATDETIDTLLSLANGELVVSLFKYLEKETEGKKMILP
jgi:hypothetical protein